MLHKITLGLFAGALLIASPAGYSWGPFKHRPSMELEYEIMNRCASKSERGKGKRIKVCACALEKTMENGWGPDYKSDEDILANIKEFMQEFWENVDDC